MKSFKFQIRTPFGLQFDDAIFSLTVNTEAGQITVLHKHADLVTSILFSPLVLKTGNGAEEYLIRNGILEFNNKKNEARIICTSCRKQYESFYFDTLEHAKEIKAKLEDKNALNTLQSEYLEDEMLSVMQKIAFLEKKGVVDKKFEKLHRKH